MQPRGFLRYYLLFGCLDDQCQTHAYLSSFDFYTRHYI